MNISRSCRRAAVTTLEPGHVGIWHEGPLNGSSFDIFAVGLGFVYMKTFIDK